MDMTGSVSGSRSLRRELADRIQHYLTTLPGPTLPTRKQLSSQFGVCEKTMSAVLHILQQRGLIETHQGRGPRRVGSHRSPLPPVVSSRSRLEDLLLGAISRGEYRTGSPLPKIIYFVKNERVSNTTVLAVYRSIAGRGIIHKKGRQWIVGPPRAVGPTRIAVRTRPVILLVVEKEHSWRGLYHANRYGDFCRSFTDEARRHAIQAICVLEEPRNSPGGVIPAGRGRVLELARSLGNRYIGSILAGSSSELRELPQWIAELTLLHKPVVWFDRYDKNIDCARSSYFARCSCNEAQGVSLALDTLVAAGHRTIGYPARFQADWVEERGHMLERAAHAHPQCPAVRLLPPLDRFWEDLSPVDFVKTLRGFRGKCSRSVRASIDLLLEEASPHNLQRGSEQPWGKPQLISQAQIVFSTPVMLPVLQDRQITAIVAYHDKEAARMYYWLRAAGVALPRDMSLISFDNDIVLHPLPVTTINFGFGNLGYAAFHFLFGDIPVRRDQRGDIVGVPFVVEGETVGKPKGR